MTLLDHEKTVKHQKIKLKKFAQENVKLENQVRTYEQRLREMRQDAVYRDLAGGSGGNDATEDEGMCAPVRDAWRSFRRLFRTAWFRFWLKLQIRLEDKQRHLSREDPTHPPADPMAVAMTTRKDDSKEVILPKK